MFSPPPIAICMIPPQVPGYMIIIIDEPELTFKVSDELGSQLGVQVRVVHPSQEGRRKTKGNGGVEKCDQVPALLIIPGEPVGVAGGGVRAPFEVVHMQVDVELEAHLHDGREDGAGPIIFL